MPFNEAHCLIDQSGFQHFQQYGQIKTKLEKKKKIFKRERVERFRLNKSAKGWGSASMLQRANRLGYL